MMQWLQNIRAYLGRSNYVLLELLRLDMHMQGLKDALAYAGCHSIHGYSSFQNIAVSRWLLANWSTSPHAPISIESIV